MAPEERFMTVLRYVLKNEDGCILEKDDGCFTNDPRDPGGATKWGIILTEYAEHLGRPFSVEEVRAAPLSLALEVYRQRFWGPLCAEQIIDLAVCTAIMDTAVNKGLYGATRLAQQVLGVVVDGHFGPKTLAALNSYSPVAFLEKFERALEFYISKRIEDYPNMEWARIGWLNRARRLLGLRSR